jgi:hypothetical protein
MRHRRSIVAACDNLSVGCPNDFQLRGIQQNAAFFQLPNVGWRSPPLSSLVETAFVAPPP